MKTMTHVKTTSHEYMAGRLIVKLKEGVSEHQINGLGKAIDVASTKAVGLTGAQIWHLSGKLTVEETIAKYSESDLFEYIEPDYVIKVDPPSPYVTDEVNIEQAAIIPSDNLFSNQWSLNNTGQTVNGQTGIADADIDAPEAWSIQKGDANLVIGVIDTGADYTHSDLSGNIWTNPGEIAGDGIDNDGNGYTDDIHGWDFANGDNDPMDGHGHGTRVAGIIAATGNNAKGVTGIVWNAQIMPIKFLSDAGSGSTSDAILAINYATSMGVKLTNNSWGGDGYSAALYDAINTAEQQGALFIAAAGNGGADKIGDNNDIFSFYPSGYDLRNIISVASTTSTDSLSSYSNYGAVSVDLAAPGSNIYSTSKGGAYGYSSGTSMAAPHVTGAAALLWSRYPTLTAQQVKDTLLQSTDTLGSLAGMVASNGRLNVNNALVSLNHIPTATDKTISINENSNYVFSAGDFGYSDADNDLFVSFNIASLTAAGELKLNGIDVVPNQIISEAEISLLTFTPEVNATGINYANFDFTVSDGIANSTTPNNISFNVINIIFGTNDNDNLLGNAGIDQILGLGGDDILNGAAGADFLIGGLGNDNYVVDNAGDAVTENLNEGTDKINSSVTYSLPANVENLTLTGSSVIDGAGNDLANSLIGNTANNVLTGGAGNDTLDGKAGADTLLGGLGNDTYTVDNTGDVVTENPNEGTDKINSSVTYTLSANVENLTLTGSSIINGTGNDLANSLIGNTASNVLTGGAGKDTLDGKAGADTLLGGFDNDTYTVDNTGDVVTENLNEGTDKINSSVTYTLSANVENLTLTGSAIIDGTGNNLANTLIGNTAANQLDGGSGNDTLDGGLGNNVLTGGTGKDTFKITTSGHVDTITDYKVADDTIKLENAVFTVLTTTGTIAASQFKIGTNAADADDYIIYNNTTGALLYDADGSGLGAAVQIATLTGGLAMTNADIVVI